VKRFIEALFSGRITESEKILETMSSRSTSDEHRRYLLALQGIYYSYVNDDYDSLLFRIFRRKELFNKRSTIAKSFARLAQRPGRGEDPYFKAWGMVMRILDKSPRPHKLRNGATSRGS